ncbi:hypothetical protein [Leptospira kemamanensis]|nr:hypothetical protein [Leptospira kemamanensis]
MCFFLFDVKDSLYWKFLVSLTMLLSLESKKINTRKFFINKMKI